MEILPSEIEHVFIPRTMTILAHAATIYTISGNTQWKENNLIRWIPKDRASCPQTCRNFITFIVNNVVQRKILRVFFFGI